MERWFEHSGERFCLHAESIVIAPGPVTTALIARWVRRLEQRAGQRVSVADIVLSDDVYFVGFNGTAGTVGEPEIVAAYPK